MKVLLNTLTCVVSIATVTLVLVWYIVYAAIKSQY